MHFVLKIFAVSLLVLLPLSAEAKSINIISANDIPMLRIPNFGFMPNGTFRLNGTVDKPCRMRIVFVASRLVHRQSFSYRLVKQVCDMDSPPTKNQFFFDVYADETLDIDITVSEANVFYIYLFNCDNNVSVYNLTATYANAGSRLDSRDTYIDVILDLFTVAHFLLFLIWISNSIRYPMCRIRLHTLFVLLPLMKAFALMKWSRYTCLQKMADLPDYPGSNPVHIVDIIYYISILSSFALALGGWGIYRDNLLAYEYTTVIGASMMISLSSHFLFFVDSLLHAFVLLGCLFFGVFWYLKICVFYLIMMVKILDKTKNSDPIVAKSKLARSFAKFTFGGLGTTLSLCFISSLIGLSHVTVIFFQECGFLVAGINTMRLFLIRKQYLGNESTVAETLRKSVSHPKTLVSPTGRQEALLTRTD